MVVQMARQARSPLPAALDAVQALGAQIAAARRELGWTAAELAGRLGVTPALVSRIEQGSPGTAVGTVLEAAVLCGVPLFGVDAADLRSVADQARTRVALLPQRVRTRPVEISDAF
jgi:transcriptional regulator with XRE-family HTH domain